MIVKALDSDRRFYTLCLMLRDEIKRFTGQCQEFKTGGKASVCLLTFILFV